MNNFIPSVVARDPIEELFRQTAPVAPKPVTSNVQQIVIDRDPYEKEFHQAVQEVLDSVAPVLDQHPEYGRAVVELIDTA